MKTLLLTFAILLFTGCTSVQHVEKKADGSFVRHSFISVGVKRNVKLIQYGALRVEGLNSDESKGLESAVKGAKGL